MAERKSGAHLKSAAEREPFRFGRAATTEKRAPEKKAAVANHAPSEKAPSPAAENPAPTKAELREKRRKRRKKELRNLAFRSVLYLIVVYVLFFHIVGVTIMPGGDMSPRLESGDLVVYYRLGRDIHAQDVVVLEKAMDAERASAFGGAPAVSALGGRNRTVMDRIVDAFTAFDRAVKELLHRPLPEEKGEVYVSRIIAGPGDTVEINESERPIVNGNAVVESNIFYSTPEYAGFVDYPVTLGDGEYFVLSDYRQGAADSRFFGPVQQNDILGVVITVARRNNL